MPKIQRPQNIEASKSKNTETKADKLDFKQNLILWTVLRSRDSDDQVFRQTSRKLLEEYIHGGTITRDFLKPIYESLGMGDNFDDRKLSPSIIQDELIPLDQKLLAEETQEQKTDAADNKTEVEMPFIGPEEVPAVYRLQDTILPADDKPQIKLGNGTFEQAGQIPRAEILTRLLLDSKFENLPGEGRINKKDIIIITGKNSESMVRKESYRLFLIRRLNKIVFVCNEEGNNTFVINGIIEGIDGADDISKLEPLYDLKKSELKELKNLDLLEEVRWGKKEKWEEKLKVALQKESTLIGPIEKWLEIIDKLASGDVQLETAPEGWMTCGALAEKMGKTYKKINGMATQLISKHSEWNKKYKHPINGKIFEYFSPELVNAIEIKLLEQEQAPDGWMTNHALCDKLIKTTKIIHNIAEQYRQEHPEWFKMYLDQGGHSVEHISPELLLIITNKLSEEERAPENWITNKALAKKLNQSQNKILQIANKYRVEHPEWFKKCLNKINQEREHYSPELTLIITDELAKIEKPPEGWLINLSLSKLIDRNQKVVSKRADRYRTKHPEWFKKFLDKTGRKREYYSPELVAIITEELSRE